MTCAWPTGCFQHAWSDDPDGVCAYHRKVLDGLITITIPDVPEFDAEEGSTVPRVSGTDVDTTTVVDRVPPEA